MAKVKQAFTEILEHVDCYGYGWLYWGSGENFTSEVCECNPYAISADEIMELRGLYWIKNILMP